MAVKIRKGSALASLSITPLVDVVFLLLIFFLVATKFDEEDHALDIQLPEASEAVPIWSEPQSLVVNVNRLGEYFISGRKISQEEMEPILKNAWKNPVEDSSVIIRGDARAPFGTIVTVADLCRKLDINYSTITREE
ncbi:MAG: biopolymer transporter ExbD [Thermoguttaceae bacterium]|nr:biopolymer transporter ExbD [Thermoguttaceae bacterium]MDO4425566.1 biopolymer transporter ExbD [Planctomycetia bacterium]